MVRRCGPLVLVAAVLALLAAGCSQSAKPAASSAPRNLADCLGRPQVQPAIAVVRCADASLTGRELKSSGWGSPVATATGMVVNNCEFIDCHTGSCSAYPVVLVVSGA